MPVTRSRTYLADIGLEDSNNTTGFLFGDEDSNPAETRTTPTAAQPGNTDAFPSLFRQQAYPTMVSLPLFQFGCRQAVCLFGACFALSFTPSLDSPYSRFLFCHFICFRNFGFGKICTKFLFLAKWLQSLWSQLRERAPRVQLYHSHRFNICTPFYSTPKLHHNHRGLPFCTGFLTDLAFLLATGITTVHLHFSCPKFSCHIFSAVPDRPVNICPRLLHPRLPPTLPSPRPPGLSIIPRAAGATLTSIATSRVCLPWAPPSSTAAPRSVRRPRPAPSAATVPPMSATRWTA